MDWYSLCYHATSAPKGGQEVDNGKETACSFPGFPVLYPCTLPAIETGWAQKNRMSDGCGVRSLRGYQASGASLAPGRCDCQARVSSGRGVGVAGGAGILPPGRTRSFGLLGRVRPVSRKGSGTPRAVAISFMFIARSSAK